MAVAPVAQHACPRTDGAASSCAPRQAVAPNSTEVDPPVHDVVLHVAASRGAPRLRHRTSDHSTACSRRCHRGATADFDALQTASASPARRRGPTWPTKQVGLQSRAASRELGRGERGPWQGNGRAADGRMARERDPGARDECGEHGLRGERVRCGKAALPSRLPGAAEQSRQAQASQAICSASEIDPSANSRAPNQLLWQAAPSSALPAPGLSTNATPATCISGGGGATPPHAYTAPRRCAPVAYPLTCLAARMLNAPTRCHLALHVQSNRLALLEDRNDTNTHPVPVSVDHLAANRGHGGANHTLPPRAACAGTDLQSDMRHETSRCPSSGQPPFEGTRTRVPPAG